ncbi:hybrid PKS-NRPS [Aspergillus sclerotiicarbonarius CBS 121057]|uniref:Hybrid PKS-NRPS n=1 Tax=Aspergillus sclerotiicarbonarius (strain CBS 121057 / IBT 28362) TaxID=1448318 RepID=A0A319FLV8_ASPSB|nr:hybrid PKS-NRPS [Aspergillus sclerotiicarbonarius CBS 121057]
MGEPIAVVGSACRFPGGATSTSKLWQLLRQPTDVLSHFPPDRLNLDRFYHPDGEHHGSTDVQGQSYLLAEDCSLFDAAFFNINPLEADGIDPQQRILLETVYEAVESAGCTLKALQGSSTSVHVGVMNADYWDLQIRDTETLGTHNATGTARSILSNRISYFFDLKGPSMTIDTACSSSLVGLHLAVQGLRNGDATAAIVAGANLILDPAMYIAESSLHMLSPDSRCRMWDKDANGYARGEGFAALLLKPLSRAIQDGDQIEGIIRETGVNSDGRTKGITMPSAAAQTALIRQTYCRAGLDPVLDRCQYFECHGTGTLAGDPVEARAIRDAFFPDEQTELRSSDRLFVGSIKTVIGHLEGCAGLAGVLKALLAIRYETIPPNMHFNDLNPSVAPFYGNLKVPTESTPWPLPAAQAPRRASVNSFGFGGTNAHAIIESYHPPAAESGEAQRPDGERFVGPLVFSAQTGNSLVSIVKRFERYIDSNPELDLEQLAYALQARTTFPTRSFFSGSTRTRLLQFMNKFVSDAEAGSTSSAGTRAQLINEKEIPGVLGVFTGQGAQWASMGRGLIQSSPLFRASLERSEQVLRRLPDGPSWSLIQELTAEEGSRLPEAEFAQPLCTALQIAMVDLLRAAKIPLHAVVGHSSGEIAAVYAAGIITADAAMQIAYYRGYHAKLAGNAQGQNGSMMAVGTSYDSAMEFCSGPDFSGRITVAASNSPLSVTLSGDTDAITEAKQHFDNNKIFTRILRVDKAYHSHHMRPCAEPYLRSLEACNIQVQRPCADCTWISSVRGDTDLLDGGLDSLKGPYWVANLLQTVLFSQAIETSIWNGGPFDVALEIGAHPALKGPVEQIFKASFGRAPYYAGLMRRGDDEVEAFSGALGFVWSYLGPSFIDFCAYGMAFQQPGQSIQGTPKVIKDMPSYAWDNKRYWKESRISRQYRLANNRSQELLGRRVADDADYDMRWRNVLHTSEIPWIRGHEFQGQVLFPGAGYVAMAFEAARAIASGRPVKLYEVQNVELSRAIVLPDNGAGVETVFNVKINNQKPGDTSIQAEFSCSFSTADGMNTLTKACTGTLVIHLGDSTGPELPPRAQPRSQLVSVDMDRFYTVFEKVGLNYQGLFRGMLQGQRSLGVASTTASWLESDMSKEYLVHPAFLDVTFQSLYVAFASPASGEIWAPYLPVRIHRLTVDPNIIRHTFSPGEIMMHAEAFITHSSSALMEGDICLYPSTEDDRMGLQVEGIAMQAVTDREASDDRCIFATTSWGRDIGYSIPELSPPIDVDDTKVLEALERTALYYYKDCLRMVRPDDISSFKWYHQRMFEAAETLINLIQDGHHPVAKSEWLADSYDTIMELDKLYGTRVDLRLIHAVGRKLVSVVRGETQLLEVMLEDNLLNRFYMEGLGFSVVNDQIATVVEQITFKHPQANILEIGAGTGGTTRSILDTINESYGSYTYTDISKGFFEAAAEKFHDHRHKMVFKAMDIEKDVLEQGFSEQSYDIIIAANVLHATRNLNETMQQARSLLRPGGFLVMMEITGLQILRTQFIMGGLPGWWLGADEGRVLSPAISAAQWHKLLQRTGFSGIDSIMHDMADEKRHSFSLIVSQAVDDTVNLLRDPVVAINNILGDGDLVIVGGNTLPVMKICDQLRTYLSPWTKVTLAESIDKISVSSLTLTSVICLEELDRPLFAEPITPAKLQALQDLFSHARNVLWVTCGRQSRDPYSNMTLGIARSLFAELPQAHIQFLDVDTHDKSLVSVLLKTYLQLHVATTEEYAAQNTLWKTEPEVIWDDGQLSIPRVVPNKALNNRYNSARRKITMEVSPSTTRVELASTSNGMELREATFGSDYSPSYRRITTKYSIQLPGTGAYLCAGILCDTGRECLVTTGSNASIIDAEVDNIILLESHCNPHFLRSVSDRLIAACLLQCIPDGRIFVYEPDVSLRDALSTNRKFLFATSDCSRGQGWIQIHPYLSQRALNALIPRDVTAVVDLSRALPDRIRSFVARDRAILQDVQSHKVLDPVALQDIVAEICAQAEESVDTPSVHIKESESLSPGSMQSVVLDWTGSDLVDAVVRPLPVAGMFSSTLTYLLVGMTGDLGLSLTRWMVQHGARSIVLTSRDPKISPLWLAEMKALGADIQVHQMDVSSRASVEGVVKHIRANMFPIGGVCNAAMVLSDQLFTKMNVDTLTRPLGPKVDGTRHLDEIFKDEPLEFFVLFSSLATVIGNAGQSNYHAANMFMEAITTQRRARGLAASIIHIGLVTDVGYVARHGLAMEEHLRKLNFMPLSETDFHHFFAEAVMAGKPGSRTGSELIVGLQPVNDSQDERPPWESNPRFSHYFSKGLTAKSSQQQDLGEGVDIRQQIAEAESVEALTEIVQAAFSLRLEAMMQMVPNSVDIRIPLIDLGCDSLLAVEIRTWFLRELGMDVPVLKVLSGDSVAQICEDTARKFLGSKLNVTPKDLSQKTNGEDKHSQAQLTPSTLPRYTEDAEENAQEDAQEDAQDTDTDSTFNSEETDSRSADDGIETPQSSSIDLSQQIPLETERMSYSQSRLWFSSKSLDPTTCNVTVSYQVRERFQLSRLTRALGATIAHHPALRTRFFEQIGTGQLMQQVMLSPPFLPKHVHSDDRSVIQREFDLLKNHKWDLESGQTFGVTIIQQGSDCATVIFGYHHIILDGVSWSIFLKDLSRAYQMQDLSCPGNYLHFTRQEYTVAESGDFSSQLEFWRQEHEPLSEVMPLLPLAKVAKRSPLQTYDCHVQRKEIDQHLVAKIRNASRKLGATPFHFHLAVIQVVFALYLGMEDMCIGIADANRTDEEFAETVGFFLNLLPLRLRLEHSIRFSELVRRTSRKVYESLSNAQVPFSLMLQHLDVPRSASHSPLFQVAVNYRMGAVLQTPLGDCQLEFLNAEDTRNPYDISFGITETASRTCLLEITCQDSLYSTDASASLIDSYVYLLDALSDDPSVSIQDCSLVDSVTADQAIALGRGPRMTFDWPTSIIERFDLISQKYTDHVAIKDASGAFTYAQLDARVDEIMPIVSNSTGERRVATLCEPSVDAIACMLAILRAGGVYVPLDTRFPAARHLKILQTCEPSVVLYHSATHDRCLGLMSKCPVDFINVSHVARADQDVHPIRRYADPDSPAFLLYTSGSTGVPKGIMLTQANFANHLALKTERLAIGQEVVLQQSSLGFDMSIVQTFCALANGGALVIASKETRGDSVKLAQLIRREKVTLTIATPTEYMMMLQYASEELKQSPFWKQACMGGESVTDQLKREFWRVKSGITLTNCYGPTEITAAASFQTISSDSSQANVVGKALPNYSIYLLDQHRRPVPIGCTGEIYVGGAGVARGYLGLSQTESSFLPDPFASSSDRENGWTRMYRTGDRGRFLSDGSLIFQGRINGDSQVKLRGLRIELEEVEQALLQAQPGLFANAVVTTRGDPAFLLAHVVLAPGKTLSHDELQVFARALPLPEYMVPAMIVPVDSLPTNVNGKVDRKAVQLLALPDRPNPESHASTRLTLSEGQLVLLWKRVLPESVLSVLPLEPDSDFFMHGGNSILLMKLQGAIKQEMGVVLSINELYQASTVRRMAALIAEDERLPQLGNIDWEEETALPETLLRPRGKGRSSMAIQGKHEVLLTGGTSFLGRAMVEALERDPTVKTIHCVAVPIEHTGLSQSRKVVCYPGSLVEPSLGLTEGECEKLRSSISMIIHAGANGHCLNNYFSLRTPNLHSTRFLAEMALPRSIPVHFISSNRVGLLSGQTAVPAISVSDHPPRTDGSEGFTATKWASECFLEKVCRRTGLSVTVHRPCALTGDRAPSEDALNALLRYSLLTSSVPRFDNFEGYFDFRDVHQVATEIVSTALASRLSDSQTIEFVHHSSGVKVPVHQFRQHMERLHGGAFEDVSVAEWIERALRAGIDPLITTYLEAMVQRGERIQFPYLGNHGN